MSQYPLGKKYPLKKIEISSFKLSIKGGIINTSYNFLVIQNLIIDSNPQYLSDNYKIQAIYQFFAKKKLKSSIVH